jgi:hypothetical protein
MFIAEYRPSSEVGKSPPTIGQLKSAPDALDDEDDAQSSAAVGVPVGAGFRASQAASAADA